jgi:hypothetical protein
MKRSISFVLILGFVLMGSLFSQEFSLRDIKDKSLRITLSAYTKSDLAQITNLSLTGSRIYDISDLGKLSKLVSLDLFNNRISNIASLSQLSNLRKLSIADNFVSDISSLSNLPELSVLDLSKNPIRSLAGIDNLTSLKELILLGVAVSVDSFKYWKFTDKLQIYDRGGKFYEIPQEEKEKWYLLNGELLPVGRR